MASSRVSHTSARLVAPSPTQSLGSEGQSIVVSKHASPTPVPPHTSQAGKGIGNLLDSLPGTGPRTLLGALALVVGVTFWLQPESSSEFDSEFHEAGVGANTGSVESRDIERQRSVERRRPSANGDTPRPAVGPTPAANEAPSSSFETDVEARTDTVLR